MSTPGDLPTVVSAELRSRRVDLSESPWSVADDVGDAILGPGVLRWGRDAVVEALRAARSDPYVAMMLVNVSGASTILPPPPLHLGSVFEDDELVDAAVLYLERFPDAGIRDGAWAWIALLNGWEQLQPDDHARLVAELLERAPENDRALWMVADGPLAVALTHPVFREQFDAATASDAKMQRFSDLLSSNGPS